MNILFLTIGTLVNLEDSGIYSDLLRRFRDNGHEVYVVSPREKRLGLPTEYVEGNRATFLKVRTGNITKAHLIEKGFSTVTIERLYIKAIKKYLSDVKFDLILYSTPPVTLQKVVEYVKKRDNARTYLILKDIFPQNAVDLGMLTKTGVKGLLYKYFRLKEKKLYRISDYIGCMSPANVDYILKHNPELSHVKIEVCPNSIELVGVDISDEDKRKIRVKYNIPAGKTIFIYGGNLGKPQGVDFLIDCIKANEYNENSYFLIVGSGTEFKKLRYCFEKENFQNAMLLNHLPKVDYELLANSCDVGLIFLDKRFTIPNFPSRLLSYMQASMPVVAATDVNTDIGKVIENGKFGYWCESSDVNGFNEKVEKLLEPELRRQMGSNARNYLETNYTTKHSYEIIMAHFI